MMELAKYNNGGYTPGRRHRTFYLWQIFGRPLIKYLPSEWLCMGPLNRFKSAILRIFGAAVGENCFWGAVDIQYPWHIRVGDNCWIGKRVELYSLDKITLGNNVCISQNSFLCTGSHDMKKDTFDLITGAIVIEDCVWVAANCFVGPGVTIKKGAVVGAGSTVLNTLPSDMFCAGSPCSPRSARK